MSSELIPAATVILVRARAAISEILMVRRDSRLAFAGGAWVFPGGRIDPEDYAGQPGDLAGAERRAAAREASEEVGLAVDVGSLVRWSHWTPPDHGQSHRFSTAFFIAPAPSGEVVVDDGEIREHRWVTPSTALELRSAGEIELTPPTFITLFQLAQDPSLHTWLGRGESEVERFNTVIAADGDSMVALYHGDAGYETADPAAEGARHRLVMGPTDWRYVRD
ncbi:MAG: NUDIX hydrolase [Microthrixaceae bacterium]|nr:NUDIX hydrolase [Microthrixaceae bacterium]